MTARRTSIVRRFLLLYLGGALVALVLAAALAVVVSGKMVPPVRLADLAGQARMSAIRERFGALSLRVFGSVMYSSSKMDRGKLEQLLKRHPELAMVEAGANDLSRPGATPVGRPQTIGEVRVTYALEPLARDLFDAAPAGTTDALLSPEGKLLVGNAPLPPDLVPGEDMSYLVQVSPLRWARVHVAWLQDIGLGVVVATPIGSPTRVREILSVLGIFTLCLSLAAWLAATYVTRPLHGLREAARRLAEGREPRPLRVTANDEVGDLAREFERMADTIAEREAELRRASDLKSRFLASVSHELRTPLTSIVGYCGMLRDGLQGPLTPKQQDVVGRIASNAETLVGQIEELLDIGRIEAGRLDLRIETVDLAECLESAHAAVAPQIQAKSLAFEVALPDRPVEVQADFQRLRQVFVNLLSNAARYTESGTIGVKAIPADDAIEVTIWDTGPGIPEEDRKAIFEEFHRAGSKSEGAGLGLSISQRLVEAHGGRIEVRAHEPQGSAFVVTLPQRPLDRPGSSAVNPLL